MYLPMIQAQLSEMLNEVLWEKSLIIEKILSLFVFDVVVFQILRKLVIIWFSGQTLECY